MYAKIQYELCLYMKIQIFLMYIKIQNTVVGVSLTDNHHLRVIVMIQHFASHYQGRPIPSRGYRA